MSDTKPFDRLLGKRVAIANFTVASEEGVKEEKKSEILLLDETQKVVDAEKAEKEVAQTERFTVAQVGEGCESLTDADVGKEVHIEKAQRVLNPQNAEPLIQDGKIIAFIIPERDIAGVY